MFGKSTMPLRKGFQLSSEQISQDIEAVCLEEEQRNKLYSCLDTKPPSEHKFSKVEEFLKGTDNLEDSKQKLEDLVEEVEHIVREIDEKLQNITSKVNTYRIDS